MKLSTNVIFQILGVATQGFTQASDAVPMKAKFWVSLIAALLQLVSGVP